MRDYKPGGDPAALLTDINQIYYPVTAGDQVRAGILLEQKGGRWQGASFGNAGLAKKLAELRKLGAPARSETLVELPALSLYFLARKGADNKLTLTSVSSAQQYKIAAGEPMPADQALTTLVPFAKDYNGLPM